MEKNNNKQEERSSAAASASGNKSPGAAETNANRTEYHFKLLKLDIKILKLGERRTALEAQQKKIESEKDDSKRKEMVEELRQGIVAARKEEKAEEKRAAAAKAEAEIPIELRDEVNRRNEAILDLIKRIDKRKADKKESKKSKTYDEIFATEEAIGKKKGKSELEIEFSAKMKYLRFVEDETKKKDLLDEIQKLSDEICELEMKKPVARPVQSKKETGTASVALSTRPAARPEQSKNDDIRRKERGKGIAQVQREVKGIVIGEATAKPEAKPKQSLGNLLKIEEKAKSPNKQTFGSLLDKAKKKEEKRSAGRK